MNEKSAYHGEVIPQGNFEKYGHYSETHPIPVARINLTRTVTVAQVMWKSTTKVGIASATDGKGAYYIVARYAPAGNFVGQKPY